MNQPSSFQIGNSVRIKAGAKDVDFDVDIGGWQGRVRELYPDQGTLLIALDSLTLRQMSSEYIVRCEEKGMSWSEYIAGLEEVELAAPRDKVKDVTQLFRQLAHRYRWAYLGEEGQVIAAVVGNADDESRAALKRWERHFQTHLTFPFQAMVTESMGYDYPAPVDGKVRVLALAALDNNHGILVTCRWRFSTFKMPLAELEVVDKQSPQHAPVQAYATWFANR